MRGGLPIPRLPIPGLPIGGPAVVRLAVGVLAMAAPAGAQVPALPESRPTPAERLHYLDFTAPEEVAPYLETLAGAAAGVTDDVLEATEPIPIIRLAARPGAAADPRASSVVRVLVIAAQHGTERAGMEAALRIARDLAVGRLAGLRDALDVRIVPMANPPGVREERAVAPGGADLARDHVRLSSAEARALWREYAAWRPHLVVDLHEIGPSEYPVQVAVSTHPSAPGAHRFGRFFLLPFVANDLVRDDIPFQEYVAEWRDGAPIEGAAEPVSEPAASDAAVWFTPPPMDPASATNAFALAGSVSFFVAVASSGDIMGLEDRTGLLHHAVRALLTAAAGRADGLVAAAAAATRTPKDALALRTRYVEAAPDASRTWIFINDRGQREQGRLSPWRSDIAVEAELEPPAGWWIEPGHEPLVAALRGHGFEVLDARSDVAGHRPPAAPLLAYPRCTPSGDADAVRASLRPHEGPLPAGAAWVPADQPGGRLLFTILEPWSARGWFAGEGSADAARDADAPAADCDTPDVHPVYRVSR